MGMRLSTKSFLRILGSAIVWTLLLGSATPARASELYTQSFPLSEIALEVGFLVGVRILRVDFGAAKIKGRIKKLWFANAGIKAQLTSAVRLKDGTTQLQSTELNVGQEVDIPVHLLKWPDESKSPIDRVLEGSLSTREVKRGQDVIVAGDHLLPWNQATEERIAREFSSKPIDRATKTTNANPKARDFSLSTGEDFKFDSQLLLRHQGYGHKRGVDGGDLAFVEISGTVGNNTETIRFFRNEAPLSQTILDRWTLTFLKSDDRGPPHEGTKKSYFRIENKGSSQ